MFELQYISIYMRWPRVSPPWFGSRQFLLGSLLVVLCLGNISEGHDDHNPNGKGGSGEVSAITGNGGGSSVALGPTPCSNGFAGPYPCSGINLYSFLPLSSMGGTNGNDIWGWTSPNSGKDYAIMGRENGTRFVDVSDPTSPIYLGNLATAAGTGSTVWRDMKVYQNHAYIVADGSSHGLQVFDLSQLDGLDRNAGPVSFSETAHYGGFTKAHNIVINEESGFAYAVGTNTYAGGLHAINLQNPASPVSAGGFSSDGYTHDAQAVTYQGPDDNYVGREIVFASNEDTVTIVDVTNKNSQTRISRANYANTRYIHQGWLTEDHRYFLQNDELDEVNSSNVNYTRTHIWDMKDLTDPTYLGFYAGKTTAIDHNLYTYDGLAYEANYASGLRVLDLKDIRNADITEVGYFDVVPSTNASSFNGAWSVYKFEDSGTVIVNGREQGLFVLDTQGLVAETPTKGVINGSFEQVLGPTEPILLSESQYANFSGYVSGGSSIRGAMIPGWTVLSGDPGQLFSRNVREDEILGAGDESSSDFLQSESGIGTVDGINIMRLYHSTEPGAIRSILEDTLEDDTLYELSVTVGQNLLHPDNAGYDVSLFAGEIELGRIRDTDLGAPEVPLGRFALVSFLVDSRNFSDGFGHPLEIRLSTGLSADPNMSTFFDLVTLDFTSLNAPQESTGLPEPASVALLLIGLGLLRIAHRRRGRRSLAR